MTKQFNRKLSILLVIINFFLVTNAFAIAKIDPIILYEYSKYSAIAEKTPTDSWAQFNLAITYAYMGKVQEGLDRLGKVDALDKNFAPKAIEYFTAQVAADPNRWQDRFRLAFAYYFNKDRDKALEQLKIISASTPANGKNAWAYGYMALVYGEQEKWDEAIEACVNALKIEPDAAAIHLAYAQALYKKGNTFKAAGEAFMAFRLQAEEKKWERTNKISY